MGRPWIVAGWFCLLATVSCGHAGDGFDCQMQNHSAEWFSGGDYRACVARQEGQRSDDDARERDEGDCKRGNARACYRAGLRDRNGDDRQAVIDLEAACRADMGDACWQASILLRKGWVTHDAARAQTLTSRACALGVAGGCADAAEATPDVATSARLNERACLLGAYPSCAKAGDMLANFDPVRARDAYDRGCRADERAACAGLSRLGLHAPNAERP
jgi:hypothetical protein